MKEYRQEQDQDHLPGCDQGLWSRTAIWRGTPDVEGLQIHSAWRRHVAAYPDIQGKRSHGYSLWLGNIKQGFNVLQTTRFTSSG